MGKNYQQQNSNISLENGNPGCMNMYSVFHVLHRHRWHRVKKMLPYKRHGGGKRGPVIADPGDNVTPTEATAHESHIVSEMPNSSATSVEERTSVSSPATKTSMKSRIKAFVTEEIKRKGRHHRSSTYPARLQLSRTNSIHHLDLSDMDLPELASNENSSHRSDTENSSIKKRKCDICAAMLTMSYLKQNNMNEDEKYRPENSKVAQENSEKSNQDSVVENQETSVAPETKQLLEALDIFDTRKEFFSKIMQDTMPPSGEYVHGLQTFNSKKVLNKSVSFPMSASVRRRYTKVKDQKSKQEGENFQILGQTHKFSEYEHTENREDGKTIPVLTRSESSHELKARNENKLVMKRFKNLRQKIGHAIKESRKEKHRIIMDAVFHKVPYGRRSSKHAKDYENLDRKHSPVSSCGSDQSASEKSCLRRTSSLNEMLNKYSRLFDDKFNSEARQHISEMAKVRQTPIHNESGRPSLGRILSSPDLRSSLFFIGEDSPCMIPADSALSVVSKGFDQRGSLDVSLIQENISQENLAGFDKTLDENYETAERILDKVEPPSEVEKLSPVLALEDMSDPTKISTMEDVTVIEHKEFLDVHKIETSVEQYDHFLRIPTEIINNNAEFKYVRDVLTLAGFSGNKYLKAWHSSFHPVDPSIYEEIENGLVLDPSLLAEDEESQENQRNDRLLLFDLINEVLLDIHERSFTYCPKALTFRSHIHPMPHGYRLLEEVWNKVNWYMRFRPETDQLLDDAVSRDLSIDDGWMNLQFEAEFVGIELEDMILDDLLDELVYEVDDYE